MLVVEDIIDTGNTMVKLLNVLQTHNPKMVKVARYVTREFLSYCTYQITHYIRSSLEVVVDIHFFAFSVKNQE